MVVSLAIAPVPFYSAIAGAYKSAISSASPGNNVQEKVKHLTNFRVDSRAPFYGLKADLHLFSRKPWRYPSTKSWSSDWNFKSTAALVNNVRENFLLEAKGEDRSFATVTGPATSPSWDYRDSTRVFANSRFAVLLGVVITIFGTVSLMGILFGRWWSWLRDQRTDDIQPRESWSAGSAVFETPSAFSFFLKKDLRRKETVEWVNMVLGKLWKIYRRGLESWLVGLLQPLIDNLKKPSYVRRVEIQRFHLGDEPLSVRSVERRTSRRANDLQYHIGLRYTGEAKMLLAITLNAGFIPVMIPVGVRGFDVDGEIWVKLRMVPSEPWVGTATWAFVSLPKIILALAPFGLFNIMTIPFISRFLTKLLTEDLPQLFVRPNKIVVNFLKTPESGPFAKQCKDESVNMDFAGELSVTLVDARKLNYFPIGTTDPYVVLMLGDQVIHSKKNSQTSIIGPPGAPIWNQDFQLLVVNPKNQKLAVRVRDTVGLGVFTVGYGEIDLSTLQDTVPTDKIVTLRGGWGLPKRFAGEIVVRLTYKAYVEDEEEDDRPLSQLSDTESDSDKEEEFNPGTYYRKKRRLDFLRDLFAAVNVVIKDLGYENVVVESKRFDDKKKTQHKKEAGMVGNKLRASQKEPRHVDDLEEELPKMVDNHRLDQTARHLDELSKTDKNHGFDQIAPGEYDISHGTPVAPSESRRPNNPSGTPQASMDDHYIKASKPENENETTRRKASSRGAKTKALGKWPLQTLSENSAVMWLGLVTGIVLLAAVSLNFSNLVNP